jgi:uncharacterized protein YecE (DUF72 family)
MAELVDARDLKSLGALPRAGSSPAPGTNKINQLKISKRQRHHLILAECDHFVTVDQLKDRSSVFRKFGEGIQPMLDAKKLGCVLIQFPSFFWPTSDNINYIKQSREYFEGVPLVIEFRNKAWVNESTFRNER